MFCHFIRIFFRISALTIRLFCLFVAFILFFASHYSCTQCILKYNLFLDGCGWLEERMWTLKNFHICHCSVLCCCCWAINMCSVCLNVSKSQMCISVRVCACALAPFDAVKFIPFCFMTHFCVRMHYKKIAHSGEGDKMSKSMANKTLFVDMFWRRVRNITNCCSLTYVRVWTICFC